MSRVYDDRVCALGEGPLWHPIRQQFFWFDIVGKRLLTRTDAGPQEWQFDENVSAAGWIDNDTLLMASETGLWRFSLIDGSCELVVSLEADNPVTRSNDGRADPWGGLAAADGWPEGTAEVYLDLRVEKLNPDGAVIDATGNMWVAQWGACRVAVYSSTGTFLKAVEFDALQTSCPAFGGADLTTLYCTTAAVGLKATTLEKAPEQWHDVSVDGRGPWPSRTSGDPVIPSLGVCYYPEH